jgi:hypothetical protein
MPAGDDGVGVSVGRVVFVGWNISVGPAVLDDRDVLAGFGESDGTSTVTAVLLDSAVTITSSMTTDFPAAVFWAMIAVGSGFAGAMTRMPQQQRQKKAGMPANAASILRSIDFILVIGVLNLLRVAFFPSPLLDLFTSLLYNHLPFSLFSHLALLGF